MPRRTTRQPKVPPPQKRRARPPTVTSYVERTQWPLQGLLFLLPLLIVYEIGTVAYAPGSADRLPKIVAESLLGRFFDTLGVTGAYLPGLLVVVVLLAWHVLRRDPWGFEPKLYLGMLFESAALAVPLFVLMLVLPRDGGQTASAIVAAASGSGGGGGGLPIDSWEQGVVLSIGAGIYEELLFRLIGIALLHALLVDLLALPEGWGSTLSVIGTAVLFAWYHFWHGQPFHWGRFAFYAIAGVYFASIYVLRGFGIVAATHAIYDVMAITVIVANTSDV